MFCQVFALYKGRLTGEKKGMGISMIRKNGCTAMGREWFLKGLLTAAGIMVMLWGKPCIVLADATATVKVGSAKIREGTDTSSAVVSSTSQGKKITITGETKDASGVAWYQVYVDANTKGYIRADLVEKNNDGDIPQLTSDTGAQSESGSDEAQGGEGASESAAGAENGMDTQYAVISTQVAKVRTAPSTNDDTVASLEKDTQVVVSGQSEGSDGKTWYFVTFTGDDGSEKTGYIRSDLLTLGDMVPVPEAEVPEQPEAEPEPDTSSVNNDYELVYQQEEDGSYVWYLHDNVGQTKQKLQQILDAAAQSQGADASEDAKALVKQRIAIVALAVLAVILIVVIIVMAVKLRDAYYEDYEDDDEDYDEDEEEDDEDDEDDEDEDDDEDDEDDEEEELIERRRAAREDAAARRRRPVSGEGTASARTVRKRPVRENKKPDMGEIEYREDGTESVMVNQAPKRKAKNFLIDDDDLEFGFLNMDDKNL